MESAYDRLEGYLKRKGLKFTRERRDILAAQIKFKHHYLPEELEAALRKLGSTVHRSTIYRLLPIMIKAGIIQEVQCYPDSRTRYEHIFGRKHHDHLHCLKCSKIISFMSESLEKEQDAVCQQLNFKPIEHRFYVYGYCSKCQAKRKKS